MGIVAGVVTYLVKIQPVREPFNQLSVRSGVDGCIFRNRGQQYSGCERNRAVSVADRDLFLPDGADVPEETLELGGA